MKKALYCLMLFLFFQTQIIFGQEKTVVYTSETLQIEQISPNTYVHISYLNTNDFGKVGCNGMLVIQNGEALVFDTPANEEASIELINWLEKDQKSKVNGVVATHFHWDCLGGLNEFHDKEIPSYASAKTIELAKDAGYPIPENSFKKKMNLKAGNIEVINQYLGEGHTKDNFVAYVPSDKVIFGGCMIKELGAGNGNLEDANVSDWSSTVRKVKSTFPEAVLVIPGHGKIGGIELLDYTIEMFEKNEVEGRIK
jgi:metallo-beta-lactamase class B